MSVILTQSGTLVINRRASNFPGRLEETRRSCKNSDKARGERGSGIPIQSVPY